MERKLSSGGACFYRSLEFEVTWFKSSRIARATQGNPALKVIRKKEEISKTYFDKSFIQMGRIPFYEKKKDKNYEEWGKDVIR